jgi:hypothetical protein
LLGTVANRFLKQSGWLQSNSIQIIKPSNDGDSHRSISATAPQIQPFFRNSVPKRDCDFLPWKIETK